MTTFFNVDVETSAIDPWYGHLLTVGIKPVYWNPDTRIATLSATELYIRIDRVFELRLDSRSGRWGNPENQRSSYGWWIQQNDVAQDEAFRSRELHRYEDYDAAGLISSYVSGVEPDPKQRIFVANPVSFDKMWLTQLFANTSIPDPFHYQSLCLRSMKFGLRKDSPWGSSRDNHTPEIPHHALSDATAQALDLIDMLNERDARGND